MKAEKPILPTLEVTPETTKSLRSTQLRLLMKEQEDMVSRLVELDYAIWELEELFRTGRY
jgi:hypothetical protein